MLTVGWRLADAQIAVPTTDPRTFPLMAPAAMRMAGKQVAVLRYFAVLRQTGLMS